MTQWQHTIIAIATPAVIPSALALLDAVMPIEGGGTRSAPFGRPLSATGTGAPTHYLISFQCTEAQRLAFDAAGLDSTPGLDYWRCSNPGDVLVTTNHDLSQGFIGSQWDWMDAVSIAGLAVIVPDIEDP